jgi:hypothetical protein
MSRLWGGDRGSRRSGRTRRAGAGATAATWNSLTYRVQFASRGRVAPKLSVDGALRHREKASHFARGTNVSRCGRLPFRIAGSSSETITCATATAARYGAGNRRSHGD